MNRHACLRATHRQAGLDRSTELTTKSGIQKVLNSLDYRLRGNDYKAILKIDILNVIPTKLVPESGRGASIHSWRRFF